MMNQAIVIISRQRLVGRTNGSSAYLLDLAETARAAGFDLHLLQPTPSVAGRWPVLRMLPEMAVFKRHHIRGMLRLGVMFVSLSPRVWGAAAWGLIARMARSVGWTSSIFVDRPFPYAVAAPWQQPDLDWLQRIGADLGETAIADYMFCAAAFAQLPGVRRRAIVMHDLFHSRAGATGDTVTLVDRDSELAMLGQCDAVIAIQATEAEFVSAHLPQVESILAPIAATLVDEPQPGKDDRLLFVGSNTGPNVEGLRWFIQQVWPLVQARRPEAVLDVAGTVGWSFAGEAPEGIRFLGMVGELDPLYMEAGVVLSPLTFGSGLKIKLVEALARGKAMVVTPVTLQGVEAIVQAAVVSAEEASAFADSIVSLAGDRQARTALASSALACAREHFGRETAHRAFARWLQRGCSECDDK